MAVIHIVEEVDGGVEVWCDVPGAEMNGIIIGLGATRQEAVAGAVRTLEALVEHLQSPPDVWETDPEIYTLRGSTRQFTIASHKFAGDV
jgi:hypothetical protein